ncbi:Hypothetical_protein [Hexamita inflata]|uniref:Hypothetical_protein n=1 Tax=Hexamita inflata TaxID=28002 RepID=A0AA86NN48_9EUKA|nr:Hypothetical protein HINF_LOCUS9741 [Hexamita inflata]
MRISGGCRTYQFQHSFTLLCGVKTYQHQSLILNLFLQNRFHCISRLHDIQFSNARTEFQLYKQLYSLNELQKDKQSTSVIISVHLVQTNTVLAVRELARGGFGAQNLLRTKVLRTSYACAPWFLRTKNLNWEPKL